LGLHFYRGAALPEHYRNGAFIGQHGSWNRSAFAGYKVIFVPFGANGRPSGEVEDFLTGFLNDRQQAQGRPVGVSEDATGAILVADDVGNIVWRVAPSANAQN
jgi:glucose/arabinose dehydrogenase